MWIPRSKPSPCARTTRMSPTRGLCPPAGAHASHFGLRVGERPLLDRPDERPSSRRRRSGCRAGCSAASRRFSAAYSAAASGSARSASRNARCRRSHALPTSHTWMCTCHGWSSSYPLLRNSCSVSIGSTLCRYPAATSGSTIGARGTSDATDTWMSITGFAASPGHRRRAHVVDRARRGRRAAPRSRAASSSNRAGHAVVVVDQAVLAGASMGLPGLRPRPAPLREQREAVEDRLLCRIVRGRVLRMPLDAEHPRRPAYGSSTTALDRLDQAVVAPAGRDEALAEAVDPLVVVRRAREHVDAGRREQPAAGRRLHVVRRDRVGDRDAVLQHPRDVGEVLMERAAERDVHDLHPATDRERREPEPIGGEQQVDLELVAVGLDAVGVLHGRVAAVARRVDVAAPHQHQPVERGQDLLGVVRLAGAHDQDAGAGPPERVDVWARDAVAAVRPARHAAGCQVVADDRDERTVRLRQPAVSRSTSTVERTVRGPARPWRRRDRIGSTGESTASASSLHAAV